MKTHELTRMSLFLALLIVLAFFPPLMVGVLGVPIVLQNFGVFLVTLSLSPKHATLTIGLLLLLAALGLPFLSGGRGGLAPFIGPTAGFMYGWLITPFAVSLFNKLGHGFWVQLLALSVGGGVLTELIGAAWLAATTGVSLVAAVMSVLIYIPGDLIKVVLATVVAQTALQLTRQKV